METGTYTHTKTNARYIAAKIATDLKRLQRLAGVGHPSDSEISEYQMEVELLLYYGYLDAVTYGFRRGREWIAALQYLVISSGDVSDQDPGRIYLNEEIAGANFGSFLIYSDKWEKLSSEEKKSFEKMLPFQRSVGNKPDGRWIDDYDNSYKSGELAVKRRRLEP